MYPYTDPSYLVWRVLEGARGMVLVGADLDEFGTHPCYPQHTPRTGSSQERITPARSGVLVFSGRPAYRH